MSPLEVAHQMCLNCNGGVYKELVTCANSPGTEHECVLWPWKYGDNRTGKKLTLNVFTKYCKWCMNWPAYKLSDCTSKECLLFNSWRYGRNPNLKGKIHSGSFKKIA